MRLRMGIGLCLIAGVALTTGVGCGGKDGGDNGGGGPGGGPMGSLGLKVTADFLGAAGLLVVDESAAGASLMLTQHNETKKRLGLVGAPSLSLADAPSLGLEGDSDTTDGGLKKVDSVGGVNSALAKTEEDTADQYKGPTQRLPAIRTIAISPLKEVYLHFENPFQYRDAPPDVDAWNMSNGYQCQIFKVKGGTLDSLTSAAPQRDSLECLDNAHFIDSWQAQRNSVFQFDEVGNLYYPGSIPNQGGKMVVYKREAATGAVSEIINANIQVQDFLVTDNGGIFYTGNTGNNNGGGSGGFFRYIAPLNAGVIEIARNWWNFIFEPFEADKAIFFGPDPRLSTTASWNTACLFDFDPSGAIGARTEEAITCGSDIWGWVNMERSEDVATYSRQVRNPPQSLDSAGPWLAYRAEQKNRCESEGQVFAGGGSQISAVRRSDDGNVYLVGNVRKKRAGTFTCSVQVRGAHCVVAGVPYLDATRDTEAECTSAAIGGTWKAAGQCNLKTTDSGWSHGISKYTTSTDCKATVIAADDIQYAEWEYDTESYNNVASPLCTQATSGDYPMTLNIWEERIATTAGEVTDEVYYVPDTKTRFQPEWANCQAPASNGGDSWSDELSALAVVNRNTKTLDLLSRATEQAINVFVIDNEVFYSSFNIPESKYQLSKVNPLGAPYLVLDNFEVYNFGKSPVSGQAFFNGLNFQNNAYEFGSVTTSPPDGVFAVEKKQGFTGTVRTIVTIE